MKFTVKYELKDGAAPTKFGGFLAVKSPMDIRLHKEVMRLPLGISFDVPVMLVESAFVKNAGTQLDNAGIVFSPGEEIVVVLNTKDADHRIDFDRGQSVAFCMPAFDSFDLV